MSSSSRQQDKHRSLNRSPIKYSTEQQHYALHREATRNTSRWNQNRQFPWKLHMMLEDADLENFTHIVSWMSDQRTFRVHHNDLFVKEVLPMYFRQTQYKSFQRQLNLWGFERVCEGPNFRGYTHQFFIRGLPDLCQNMKRIRNKGLGTRKVSSSSSPLPPRTVTPASANQNRARFNISVTACPPLPSKRSSGCNPAVGVGVEQKDTHDQKTVVHPSVSISIGCASSEDENGGNSSRKTTSLSPAMFDIAETGRLSVGASSFASVFFDELIPTPKSSPVEARDRYQRMPCHRRNSLLSLLPLLFTFDDQEKLE
eukprot:Nitzschia sp. Nitz4//scaffold83_size84149//80221//81249//NITZ4_005189-RA/size84149-processed-gene-0.68-mRNA-1//-1//CDS//3329558992//5899//frame0